MPTSNLLHIIYVHRCDLSWLPCQQHPIATYCIIIILCINTCDKGCVCVHIMCAYTGVNVVFNALLDVNSISIKLTEQVIL